MLPYTQLPDYQRNFILLLATTTLIKLWLAAVFPFTGDEAYFYQWGTHPDWGGFYDHPPMVGWWLWVMQKISSHPIVLRLPAVVLWISICFGMMDLVARINPGQVEQRWLLGSLFLTLPFTWALNFITTDTPLIFFLFFSGYAFIRAELSGKLRWDIACGVLLGLALLSKYFAGLLAITYAAYLLPRQRGLTRVVLIAAFALPFMALNLAWNSTHCWNNILFNLINRNQGAHFSASQIGSYLLMLIFLITPWSLLALVKTDQWRKQWYVSALFVIPLLLLLALSLRKQIGLHWILGFLPFLFLYAGLHLQLDKLRRHRRWNLLLGIPLLIALLGLSHLPTDSFVASNRHTDIVMHRAGNLLATSVMQDLPGDTILMTRSYSQSSLLGFHAGVYVPVFGAGSFHARLDDGITDFSSLNEKNIRIVSSKPIELSQLVDYFDSVTLQERSVEGATFWIADGSGFRFEPYRSDILRQIATSYYAIPAWLPTLDCKFLRSYGFI